MEFYKGEKKILVSTGNNSFAIIWGNYCFCWIKCNWPFYLHFILIKMKYKKNPQNSILGIITGLIFLYLFFSWVWMIYLSFVLAIIGISSNFLSLKIEKIWYNLSLILSYIIPPILLGGIFYFFVFPIALISRIFNKDPLMLSDKHDSYFIDTNKEFKKKDFINIW